MQKEPLLSTFNLVGGTALALHLGHRKSIDLDFFTSESFDLEEVKMMLIKKYDYEFRDKINAQKRESFARIPATEGTASISTTAIALVIGVLAICVFLVLTYRLPGVAASFTLIAQAGLSLAVYSAFRGLFGPEVIVALLISIFVGTDTFVCLFEKTKDEMYKGKPIERAFDEASKKSNSTIIDATVLSLIVALIVFAVGSGTIRSIATMLAVSMALCLVLTTLLVKLLCNLIFKSMKFEGKYNFNNDIIHLNMYVGVLYTLDNNEF